MASRVAIGDTAPNFDLTSTEDVVIMLADEIPRSAVLLYFFADPSAETSRRDLQVLAEAAGRLAALPVSVLGISPAKLDSLKAVQRELGLPFPLLVDDRGFSADYGVEAAAEGESPAPVLVAVDRQQRILWQSNPAVSVSGALGTLENDLKKLPSSSSNYPRQVINRLIDTWVN